MSQAHVSNFEFYNPAHIIFGAGETSRVGELTKKCGNKALIVTYRNIKELGILDRVEASLKAAGVDYVIMDGVDPNPRLSTVYEGAKIAKENGVDVLVAVGGGSAIDCAKAIAYAVFETGDLWDFFLCKRTAEKSLPIVALSTISGTGSEMNTNCVITNDLIEPHQKFATHYTHSFPKYSIIDPELYASIPRRLTACGMADTIAHVLEKYFLDYGTTPIQDRLAEGITMTVIENASVLDNPGDVDSRARLAWAATMGLNGLNDAGRAPGEYDGHTIGMVMSGIYDLAHGASLTPIIPAMMKKRVGQNPKKYAQFATRVFGIDPTGKTDEQVGIEGAEMLAQTFKSWGMPITLSEQGVPREALESIAEGALKNPEGAELDKAEVLAILESCY